MAGQPADVGAAFCGQADRLCESYLATLIWTHPDGGEGAVLTSLQTIVVEILRARNFELSEQEGYLFAQRGEIRAVFCLLHTMDWKIVDAFAARFADFPGKKVIATLEPLSPVFIGAIDCSISVWGRENLEHEIGRACLENIAGIKDRGLVDELVSTDFPKIISAEQLNSLQDPLVGERIVRPILSVDDVRELARETVAGFRHELELVPHYVFEYTCPLYMDGRRVGVERGILSVNGLTSKVESWEEGNELVYALETSHRRLEPTISGADAQRAACLELVRVHTFEKEQVREEDHVTLTEKRRVAPREEDIELHDMGIFFIPIWCVEGIHGALIINAGTGKVVSEDYYLL